MSTDYALAAAAIRRHQAELAEAMVACQYQRQPELWQSFGESGRAKSVRDAGYHLVYLAEALEAGDPILFTDYLAWVKILFSGLKFGEQALAVNLECMHQAIDIILEPTYQPAALEYIEISIKTYPTLPSPKSFIEADRPLSDLAGEYTTALLQGKRRLASDLILNSVRQGTSVRDIYLNVFQRSQREIGLLWQTNRISVAQEHYCTAATQMIMSQLYPYIFASEKNGLNMVVLCIGGELHEIGARMVADFFEMDGWDTYFLGANTPPESVLQTLRERQSHVLAISATMTYHVGKITDLIRQVRQNAFDPPVKILVGGYPFNISSDLWQMVGADGYAADAQAALVVARKLVRQ